LEEEGSKEPPVKGVRGEKQGTAVLARQRLAELVGAAGGRIVQACTHWGRRLSERRRLFFFARAAIVRRSMCSSWCKYLGPSRGRFPCVRPRKRACFKALGRLR